MVRLITPWYLYNPNPKYSGQFIRNAVKTPKKIPSDVLRFAPDMGKGMNVVGNVFGVIGNFADKLKKILK